MIQAVLFDLDGTLTDRQASLAPFLKGQYARCLSQFRNINGAAFHDRYMQLDEFGFTPRPQVYQTLVTEYSLSTTVEELVADFRAHIGGHSVLFPDTQDILRQLRADGCKLGIITNGSFEAQSEKIRTCKLDSFVDTILISAQEGIKKPEPEIFYRAAQRLSVKPTERLFVGDHPRLDVQGPQSVGMVAVWQKGFLAWPDDLAVSPDYTIDRIAELIPIVRGNNP